MKIVALIVCDDHLYSGGYKTINSLKYFNPEIEVALYNTKEIERVKEKYNIPPNLWFSAPFFCQDYIENNGQPDILIKLGADCIVLDKIDEIINFNYDVAAARNDPDQTGDRDERHNRPDIIRDIPNHEWVNADCVAIKNFKFLKDWLKLTNDYKTGKQVALQDFGKIYPGDDMSSLNVVFRNYGYNSVILDSMDSNLIYGARGNYDSGNNYCAPSVEGEYKGKFYNWASWYDITDNGGRRMMGDKIVKILHQGGGTSKEKLNIDLFNLETRKLIEKICNYKNTHSL